MAVEHRRSHEDGQDQDGERERDEGEHAAGSAEGDDDHGEQDRQGEQRAPAVLVDEEREPGFGDAAQDDVVAHRCRRGAAAAVEDEVEADEHPFVGAALGNDVDEPADEIGVGRRLEVARSFENADDLGFEPLGREPGRFCST